MPAAPNRLWDIAVLATLRERAMHPYEMQRLLRERRKDDVLVLKRGSLYQTIARLEAAGAIAAGRTSRAGNRPERTTYHITPAGKARLVQWVDAVIEQPLRERSAFLGGLSFLVHLDRREALAALRRRIDRLEEEVAELEARLADATPRVGRIHVLESEYARVMRAAELAWVKQLAADIAARRLDWDLTELLQELRRTHRPAGSVR
jgi:DNA-binding PadR family transcriptional regulator